METAFDSPDIATSVDAFADILRALHAVRNEREEAAKGTKRVRQGLSSAERAEIFAKTEGRCHVCGGMIDDLWEADHVLSQSDGGSHQANNYLAAHALCNNYRWDYSPEEFQHILKLGVWVRTQIERKTSVGRIAGVAYLAHEQTRLNRRRSDAVAAD